MPTVLYDAITNKPVDPATVDVEKIKDYCKLSGDSFYAIGEPGNWGDTSRFRVGTLQWGWPERGVTITFEALDKWNADRIAASIGGGI